jgi:osmoprotectant transport system substrate-binding protein
MSRSTRFTIVLTLVGATALSACSSTSGTSSTKSADNSLAGASFVVSSKDFTENILLGKITAAVLAAHGAKITDKTNIKGSSNTRAALTSGSIDMYWEYSGTGWITYQKNTNRRPGGPVPSDQEGRRRQRNRLA